MESLKLKLCLVSKPCWVKTLRKSPNLKSRMCALIRFYSPGYFAYVNPITNITINEIYASFCCFVLIIGLVGRVFAKGPGDLGSIPGSVVPKTLKIVLDTSLLNTQQYKVRIKRKVEWSREKSSALPYTFWSPSTTVANFTTLLMIGWILQHVDTWVILCRRRFYFLSLSATVICVGTWILF